MSDSGNKRFLKKDIKNNTEDHLITKQIVKGF